MTDVVVRPYEPADRAAVRHICFLTGFAGDPVDYQWADEESFADLFTLWYTEREPGSILVAESEGLVKGYLLGCHDSSLPWPLEQIAMRHVRHRGLAFRPGTAGFLWRTVADAAGDRIRHGTRPVDHEFHDPAFPAHLHINLLPEIRRSGAGRALVSTWLDRLRSEDVPGCFLQTLHENTRAVAFFEAMGFRRHGDPILMPGERSPSGARVHGLTMVQTLR
ncbi:MAG: GNAT family N-acetyltransferase [Actinobacteria bacterium]|nr:GNAT family N-acetyltransferase [Actinomycetota bacterium]